jgi:hypothetical protein
LAGEIAIKKTAFLTCIGSALSKFLRPEHRPKPPRSGRSSDAGGNGVGFPSG